ncbi:hypothetical protein Rsub_04860 [Raphidocelis subcapitata]|uniref:Uncharacterized protein n=1 Tax=Raphidocelis subcapitata TaxID=307507 RepID=A0A2V0NU76_9CHLO|nr:hypothetical protein Rsub_04860 [Raphidocelis subcapitata]|eukprot:GBF91191.1 hypothetical protein Rsub_04860 [Raphidocelis subcapitata]
MAFACIECGTYQNPCRCKVVGPTLGVVLCVLSAVVCFPLGALTWVCARSRGRAIMGTPVHVYSRVSNPIPF